MTLTDYPTQRCDGLTGFGDRRRLLADLAEALVPRSSASVLAVFDLAGMSEYRRDHGLLASDELLARLAEGFGQIVSPAGSCYRPRQDEFAVLIPGTPDQDDVRATLSDAACAVWDARGDSRISSWYGTCRLPDEAANPVEALMLADERLRTRGENASPRERRKSLRYR
jgi:GGDEF domain-containing protein